MFGQFLIVEQLVKEHEMESKDIWGRTALWWGHQERSRLRGQTAFGKGGFCLNDGIHCQYPAASSRTTRARSDDGDPDIEEVLQFTPWAAGETRHQCSRREESHERSQSREWALLLSNGADIHHRT